MARAQALLAQVRNPRCYADQTAALRALKNETVGHVQKKERWVELGVLEPIVKALAASRPPAKMNGKDSRANHAPPRPVSEEELARLQALELLAVFASGMDTLFSLLSLLPLLFFVASYPLRRVC